MNTSNLRKRSALSLAVGAVLMLGVVSQATAQSAVQRAQERREQAEQGQGQANEENRYPDATRESPDAATSRAGGRKLQEMIDRYDDDQAPQARAIADEIIADDSANEYERAFSAQFGAQLAYEADDTDAAIDYLQRAIELDGLGNDSHFAAMWMLAQLQGQEEQFPEALATIDQLTEQTGARTYEHQLLKGRVLNRSERYDDAIATLEQVQEIAPEGRNEWQGELMYAYGETDQREEAAALAKAMADQDAGDKRSQLNLAVTYQQSGMLEESAEVLESLRAQGLLTEDGEYRQLYSTYLNLEGHEREAAEVIEEGIDAGVLEPDFRVYQALAQAYYFSEQIEPAIETYRKAAPLDANGETWLNLARLLWQEDRIGEAKDAARKGIDMGLDDPDDAQKIIALPEG